MCHTSIRSSTSRPGHVAVYRQNTAYTRMARLRARRVEALEAAGVVWEAPGYWVWERRHRLLLAYKARVGHCDRRAGQVLYKEQDPLGGYWVGGGSRWVDGCAGSVLHTRAQSPAARRQ